ncbi:MAG: TerC family protein [Alphaproteobacteria bacterium]|nr:TerC family protein [Alphaproteobacteria bacterium]
MEHSLAMWAGFITAVLVMLAVDLGVFNRKLHAVSFKESLVWSIIWVAVSMGFAGALYVHEGAKPATEFITGYLIEKSLSADNIFVFVMIFSYFSVPPLYQHRVLFWGIIGALVLRGIMIAMGAALLAAFSWVIYLFGGFLILTGLKMAFAKTDDVDPAKSPIMRLFRKFMPVTAEFHGTKFFVNIDGKRWATPLFLVIVTVGTTDFLFALDSIPAIFAVTLDPFIVFTANVFAVLGLRSMYFMLAGVVEKFHYLKVALSAILVFVGIKMCLIHTPYKIETSHSLMVVGATLVLAIIASIIRDKRMTKKEA